MNLPTFAERDAELSAALNEILGRYLHRIPAGLTRELAAFTSSQRAEAIEAHAHSPASQRGPGRQQQQARKSA